VYKSATAIVGGSHTEIYIVDMDEFMIADVPGHGPQLAVCWHCASTRCHT